MTTDMQTFALAFTVVWGGLALYLVHLHRITRRLEAEVKARGPKPPD